MIQKMHNRIIVYIIVYNNIYNIIVYLSYICDK